MPSRLKRYRYLRHLATVLEAFGDFLRNIHPRHWMFVGFAALVVLMLPRSSQRYHSLGEGDTWTNEDLRAPFNIPLLKPEAEYQAEKKQARESVYPIFRRKPLHEQQQLQDLKQHHQLLDSLDKLLAEFAPRQDSSRLPAIQTLVSQLPSAPSLQQWIRAWRVDRGFERLQDRSRKLMEAVHRKGLANKPLSGLKAPYVSVRTQATQEVLRQPGNLLYNTNLQSFLEQRLAGAPPALKTPAKELLLANLQPNLVQDNELWRQEQEIAARQVSPYRGMLEQGQIIVRRGETLSKRQVRLMESLEQQQGNQGADDLQFWIKLLGQILTIGLVTVVLSNYLRRNRQQLFFRMRRVLLVLLVLLVMLGMVVAVYALNSQVVASVNVNLFYVLPLTMGGIIITVFFDDRIGFAVNIFLAMLASLIVHHRFDFFFIQAVAGSVAVFNVSMLRNRSQFFVTSAVLLLTYVLAYVGIRLFQTGELAQLNYYNLVLFGLNVLITLGTYPLIYLFERLTGITSDLTYLELLDSEHPLLKDLALKAPGTYQHSLRVATIAEEVARKIEANALQVHAGALFHDIGKLDNPQYFIENQHPNYNPHTQLLPQQSAQVIIEHVTRGVELGRYYNLPEEMIDFIRTHHGTSRVEFFYRQHLSAVESPDEETMKDFSYPGPLPATKEQAILMLADSAEAASRTLDNPTPEALENLVEKITASKIQQNQFSHARITFRELNKIKREIIKLLQSMYHQRIKYPEQESA